VGHQKSLFEHLIVDGGSKDGTLDILKQHSDEKLKYISEPDRSPYDAMNKGIQMAKGDIIGILNADDFYADERVLESVADAFEDQTVDSCYGDLDYVDRDDTEKIVRQWKAGPYNNKYWFRGWMPPHPTFFVRRSVYEKYGLYRLDMGTSADYELMLRFLLKHGITTRYIPRVLVKMRAGGISNVSLKNRIQANLTDRKAWKVNGLKPKPWTLWMKPISKVGQWVK
jgi:glycosyltransferase